MSNAITALVILALCFGPAALCVGLTVALCRSQGYQPN